MAEFRLDRFKYNWRGEWLESTVYKKDDIVYNGGKSYVCITAHTSSSNFANEAARILPGSNPPQPDPYWIVMVSGKTFSGAYTPGEDYAPGELVFYQGTLHLCTIPHTATSFGAQSNYWEDFVDGIDFVGDWVSGLDYGEGALVKYNGNVYRCVKAHSAGSTLEENIFNSPSDNCWDVFHPGIEWRGAWATSTVYRKGDLVSFGGAIYECITTHNSSGTQISATEFSIRFTGTSYKNYWDSTTVYSIGDIVRYGGYIYSATATNQDSQPSVVTTLDANGNVIREAVGGDSTKNWMILAKTSDFVGDWAINKEFRTGDIVQRGGFLYEAVRDVNLQDGDDSSSTDLDPEVWNLIAKGQRWRGQWQADSTITYSRGDVVYYLGSSYTCNFEHSPTYQNAPGDFATGLYSYWDLNIQAGRPAALTEKGDLLTYDYWRLDNYGDDSTLGDGRLGIGEQNQILSITADQEIFWRNRDYESQLVYVATNGKDEDGYGREWETPFRTIRHACEWIEDNFDPLVPTKVAVAAGNFEEIGPISIPAGCVVMGDELRATTITATGPRPEYQDDYTFHTAILQRFITLSQNLVQNIPVVVSAGNTVEQKRTLPAGSNDAFVLMSSQFVTYKNRVLYLSQSGDTNPAMTGTNTKTTDTGLTNAAAIINQNKEFIVQDCFAYINNVFPAFDGDLVRIRNDIQSFIRAMIRDLEYPGNYGTLKAADRYARAVTGSTTTDMFYCRDTTGLRNCTIEGLSGGLNPPGVYDIYQRPTGGACVSLDPGWGPDDDRMWIMKRSPYIQGVTNIGERCYGKVVNGALHNGGNKSMTSNDFTQVLSDGIGAYITNNARAELVSVFTYYCAVGYLAENGGVIRATNGNNSYGSFGSVSDGNDPLETPDAVTVNNRENEALVDSAFAGGTSDELFIFQYENCGEQYTSADATITGAGDDADIEFTDFRDGGVFEPRLINTKGSGTEGGSGFKVNANSAQITVDATSTIRLNANDPTQFLSDIQGMRIIITTGKGAGQYAYITGFDVITRDTTVAKESDNTAGWDHIIPGTDLVADFDSTTNYRIEPRIASTHPGFVAVNGEVPAAREWRGADWGYQTVEYTNIEIGNGTGDTFDDDPVPARFNVTRKGQNYNLTKTVSGAGYAVGDTLTVLGTLLGGTTPANDLSITVTEVTQDSTNAIVTFTSSGTPRGKRMVAIADPNFSAYSDDGISWVESNLSYIGDFRKVVAGEDAWVAMSNNTNTVSFSYDGENWITRSIPTTDNWVDIAYGNGTFIMIAEGSNNIVYSSDGLNWTAGTIPDSDDSTTAQWQKIQYGRGRFVAISGSGNQSARTTNGTSWTLYLNSLPAGDYDFAGLAYGDNRFIAVTRNGTTLYSLDRGETFKSGTNIPQLAGADLHVKDFKYLQGVFMAVGDQSDALTGGAPSAGQDEIDRCATTEDGLIWTERNLNNNARLYSTIAAGNWSNVGTFVVLGDGATSNATARVTTGKQAKFKADVFQGAFRKIIIWDPGSGYSESNPCDLTITDTTFVVPLEIEMRYGNGVLSQPDFINRGAGYRTSSSTITISGDGYADIIPETNEVVLDGVAVVPGPGVQIRFSTLPDLETEDPNDLKLYTGVKITDLGDDGSGTGSRKVRFTISPRLRNENNMRHGTAATLRSGYSQCRITGHDFLDIGTGNFVETNYPDIYASGNYFTAAPENEVEELNGGRVFYVSTDQDGNFRAGELFSVQQATGIVTISAEFFDLDGLSSLSLGGVRLGGSGAVINEFSTDPTFSADSNNIVPTQKAIATFLADRLSVGGSDLETNGIVAGTVKIGTDTNEISTTNDGYLYFNRVVDFSGKDANNNLTGISGTILSQMLITMEYVPEVQGGSS
jgi:hypothetical protein